MSTVFGWTGADSFGVDTRTPFPFVEIDISHNTTTDVITIIPLVGIPGDVLPKAIPARRSFFMHDTEA